MTVPTRTPAVGTAQPQPHDQAAGDGARRAARALTSAVTVLTVGGARPHGTTVSAVVAISRTPLLLGVCLRPTSTFADRLRDTPLFSVNVLGAAQERLARRFADPERPDGEAQFAGMSVTPDPLTGAPLLADCVAHLACSVVRRHHIGDHDLLVAEAVAGDSPGGDPLVSFATRLHRGLHRTDDDPDPWER
ncbi:flavin reductase family protein [Streptomyces sp. GbtcB6]|uniref:flavin reductase family protein n=1 Tax=Streptomyces sp. GbtcB6 TaxID=2824751 RepID=UPI001C306607|nr:flavin reductase family protein [Streptomyces sp. GbtcB6]